MPLQIRRGSTADRLNTVPLVGELVFDTTTGAVFIGNGSTPGGLPVTEFSIQDAQNVVVSMLGDNAAHSGITFQSVDGGTKLSATVQADLSNYQGLIVSDQGFKGNVWANDSSLIIDAETATIRGKFVGEVVGSILSDGSTTPLIDGTNGTINLDGTVGSDVIPTADSTYSLGSASYKFKDLYLSGSSIYLGDAVITSTGTAVNLPAGSTVDGSVIGTLNGDLYGSVYSNDETLMIDGANNVVNLDNTVDTDVIPKSSETYDIGSFTNKFKTLYLKEGNSLYIGSAVMGATGTAISLPAGSTVGGTPIGTGGIVVGDSYYINIVASDLTTPIIDGYTRQIFGEHVGPVTGYVTGDVKGSVFADNSTMLVDSVMGRIVGPVFADVTGNLTGNVTGNVGGNVTGNVIGDVTGDLTGSVYSLGAVKLVNATNGTLRAEALTGSASGLSGLTSTGPVVATNNGSPNSPLFTGTLANDSTTAGAIISQRRSRGTSAFPTTVLQNDYLGFSLGIGYDGSAYTTSTSISSRAVGTISSGIVPGQLEFATADSTGSLITRLALDHTGVTQVNGSLRQVVNTYSSSVSLMAINQYHETADSINYTFARGRGTFTSPLASWAGDEIAEIVFTGTNSSNTPVAAAAITVTIPDSPTAQVTSRINIAMNNGTTASDRFVLDYNGVIDHKQTALVAGASSGQVDTSSIAGYYRVKVNGVEVAVPYYTIRP